MIRLNVRCCCVPVKVLGTLPVFEKDAHKGTLVNFPIMKPRNENFRGTRLAPKPASIQFEVREFVNKRVVEAEMLDITTFADYPIKKGLCGITCGSDHVEA